MPTTTEVLCPKCNGEMWDNRATKKNVKAPDYKCADKNCDGVVWPPKPGQRSPVSRPPATQKQEFSSGPLIPGMDSETGAPPDMESGSVYPKLQKLFDVYSTCWDLAHHLAKTTYGENEQPAATAAMTATLLITAKDAGLFR